MSYKEFLKKQYHSFFLVSDSGTAQEEASIFNTPVITPRDFTERPQSMKYNCSYLFQIDKYNHSFKSSINYINKIKSSKIKINSNWLGNGKTAKKIIEILKNKI
jgi:UDP-N-acetylglucosamine 2-epimerase